MLNTGCAVVLLGRLTSLARLSVRLSVCPVRTPNSKQNGVKPDIGVNVSHVRTKRCDYIQLKR